MTTQRRDEVGLLSILLSDNWENDKVFYVYWAHTSGMRISRFQHDERSGGLTSRGLLNTETMLWHDTDGYP